jgi:hypothetical protein
MRMEPLACNNRMTMQRGVGLAGSGVGLSYGQTTKRDSLAPWKGWAFVYKARVNDTGPRQVYLSHVPEVISEPI